MAYECYLSIKGSKQGAFRGAPPRHGDPGLNWIGVLKIANDLAARPGQTGTHDPTAIRQGTPIKVVLDAGLAAPQILHAFAHNEVLTDVTVQFVQPSANGQETPYYNIQLTNCTIVSAHQYHGAPPSNASPGIPYYEVLLKYLTFVGRHVHF